MKKIFVLILFFSIFSNAQDLEYKRSIKNDSIYIQLINNLHTPIEVNLTPVDSVEQKIKINTYFIIQPKDSIINIVKIPLSIVKDTNNIKSAPYFKARMDFGDPKTIKHNDNYLYSLPFKKEQYYKIIQSFNGRFTHNSTQSKYAIDFALRKGDPVYAARGGIVVRTREKFKKNGGKELINQANKIVIMHEDGTYASYVHLKYKGVLVKPGDKVKRGQLIGKSGNTGFSTTPHLHFVVRKERDTAIPIYFEGYANKVLKKGKKYKRL